MMKRYAITVLLLAICGQLVADKFTANWKAHAEHSGRYGKR
jgi:hypothetical protein